jgi:hypothetical protein
MNTPTSAKNKETSATYLRNLLLLIDDKGGVGKSATAAHLADALLDLGCKIRLADGDAANRTLSQLIPPGNGHDVTRLDGNKPTQLMDYLLATATSDADITIIDMPGSSSKMLERAGVTLDTFKQAGIRIILGLVLNESVDAILGARAWIQTYKSRVNYFVFANAKDCPEGQPFDLGKIPGMNPVINLTGGRYAVVPRFSEFLADHYKRTKSSPRGYLHGGWAAEKLGLNIVYSGLWRNHYNEFIQSVYPHVEYLIGKPVPKPFEQSATESDDGTMDDLCRALDNLAP